MADDSEPLRTDEPEGGPVKSFLDHLEDLRWVLMKSAVALGLAMLICLLGGNYVMTALKWPLTQAKVHESGTNQIVAVNFGPQHIATFPLTHEQQQKLNLGTNHYVAVEVESLDYGTNHLLGWRINPDPKAIEKAKRLKIELINLSPAGGFIVAFQVAIYAGLVLSAPFIFYFVVSFVFPALKMKEQRYVYQGLFIGAGLFLTGVAFCYFVLMPFALSASQLYSQWLGLGAFQWRAEEYISFVCKFMLGMGLGFELPVVLLTLVKIGILDYHALSRMRRYMIVVNLILGAVLTTPEVLTQVIMFIPLQVLYEVSVWIAWYWERRDRKAQSP